jgi:hypothetical protein
MSGAAVAAALVYAEPDRSEAIGTLRRDEAGAWHLTDVGRAGAEANQRGIGEAAAGLWARRPIATMPGLDGLDRLNDLVGRLLVAGRASGGPVFTELTLVYEPADASAAVRLSTRLTVLRYHRADAHRAAWQAAGLRAEEVQALPAGSVRAAIDAETNRLDAPIYAVLDADERLELLGGLGALAVGLTGW